MYIKQLSVFVENKPGRLAEITGLLAGKGINIHALSIADTTDFGILRLIVEDVELADRTLRENGLVVKTTNVLAVSLEHRSGSLAEVLAELARNDVSIEYMYAFTSRSKDYDAMVILRLNNQEESVVKLASGNVKFLKADVLKGFAGE